jgi:transposase
VERYPCGFALRLHEEDRAFVSTPIRTFLARFLPDRTTLTLEAGHVDDTAAQITLSVTATPARVPCPLCHVQTSRIHSRYTRTLADLPWGAYHVRIQLRVRKFFCNNIACPRQIFTERLPTVAAPWARRTVRLVERLRALGLALGGTAGTRLTPRFGVPASRDTLLRLVRGLPLPVVPPLCVIGVDDWAHRKRQRYGTIIVDLERRRPVALLNDREADTLATWLRAHPGVTVIARDRMKAYRDGARAGAPQAIQVADRFHLVQNLAEALDQVFSAHGKALKAVSDALSRTPIRQADGRTAVPVPPSAPSLQEQTRAAQRRARRLATYDQVWTLHRQGWSPRAIAQQLGMGRWTVVLYLRAPTFPERKGRSDKGKSVLTPYKAYILKRWNAGCRDALQLFRAIQRQGYPGSYPTVARYTQRLRQAQGLRPREHRPGQTLSLVGEGQHMPLTTRRATRLVLQQPMKCTDADAQLLTHLKAQHSEIAVAIELAQDFAEIVRTRQPDRFDSWLDRAAASGVAPLQRFATGLRTDYEAVKAGITLSWSNGPVEGQINRLKMLKRQMFGRANIDLLRRRFLLAA